MKVLATIPVIIGGGMLGASASSDIQAGQWEATSQIVAVEGQGLPAGMADMMKGQVHTHSYCMTQAEIDDNPQAMFDQTDGQCQYTNFNMRGGRLDATAVCNTPQGNMQMEMSGTYTATTFQSQNRMVMNTPMGNITMTAKSSGKRTGACTG